MSLTATPSGERVHIGIFGRRNAGKSSLINALTNQQLAIVSDILGTTTDPVYKAMEILPLGPVMIIDTPGIDDEGAIGQQRIEKAYQVLNKTHIALLVIDAKAGIQEEDRQLWQTIMEKKLPAILVVNKCDLLSEMELALLTLKTMEITKNCIFISAEKGQHIVELRQALAALQPKETTENPLTEDLFAPGDVIILVTPIDSAAPKGRLILPQQLVLRNILDHQGLALVVQESELAAALSKLVVKPKLVITDSQAFGKVNKILPTDIPLTSFSILMARYKGTLKASLEGIKALRSLENHDRVLISEGCTHHRQCGDIGTVKLPKWIREFTAAEPSFTTSSGTEFPRDLSPYKLILHCGGCMLNEKEMQYRYRYAQEAGVPITNYGLAIAYLHGILQRSLAPLPGYLDLLK